MKDPQSDARIRDLEQRMAAMPGSRIFVGLAEEYRRAGRFADALATLRNGLEAHPTYLSARIAIARLFQETGRVEEAVEAFSKVLAADRENLVAAKALGDLYGKQGNTVEAVKKFKLYRALSGDRSVDERIAALEREAKAEGTGPAAPAAPPAPPKPPPAAAPAPAIPPSGAPASRLFDPMNYADTSGAFELGPNATLALSTLDFAAAEEPELTIATTIPAPIAAGPSSEVLPAVETEEPAAAPVEAIPAALAAGSPADQAESLDAAEQLPAEEPEPAEESQPREEIPASLALSAMELPVTEDFPTADSPPATDALPMSDELPAMDDIRPGDELPEAEEAEEVARADELPSETDEESSAMPDLPPSRSLAELYERQGFPEEARHIYDRLDAAADAGALSATDRFAPPAEAPPEEMPDPRSRKRRAIESWLSRVKSNASTGAR